MKGNIFRSIIIIIAFLIGFYGRGIIDLHFNITPSIQLNYLRVLYAYAWWLIPPALVLWIYYGYKNILKEFKLDQPFGKGLVWATIIVSPMLISSVILGKFNSDLAFLAFVRRTFLAGFFEEIFFRAFFFGQLFARLKWLFYPGSRSKCGYFCFGSSISRQQYK